MHFFLTTNLFVYLEFIKSLFFLKLLLLSLVGYCCALYDKGLGRVIEDFNRRCPECDVQYLSNNYELGRTAFYFLKYVCELNLRHIVYRILYTNINICKQIFCKHTILNISTTLQKVEERSSFVICEYIYIYIYIILNTL